MAFTELQLVDQSGLDVIEAPVGFSWTTLFFGPLPMLYRRNWQWLAICTILWFLTGGLSTLVFMFTINKINVRYWLSKGYRVRPSNDTPIEYISDLEGKLKTKLPLTTNETH